MNRKFFTLENVFESLQIKLDERHKAILTHSEYDNDITGDIAFFDHNGQEFLEFTLFENGNIPYFIGTMNIKDDNNQLKFPIQIKNETYLNKLNDLNKFYSIFVFLEGTHYTPFRKNISMEFYFEFDRNIELIENSLSVVLTIKKGNQVISDVEKSMRMFLISMGLEEQTDSNSTEELISLIQMIRV